MTKKIAIVPFPIVQSQMFLPVMVRQKPYIRRWVDSYGNKNRLIAPQSLNHYDLVNFLGFLHLAQRKHQQTLNFTPEILESGQPLDRLEITLNMSDFYSLLGISDTGDGRTHLVDSLDRLSTTSLRMDFKHPENYDGISMCTLTSLIGDIKIIRPGQGKANRLVAHPYRDLIRNNGLIIDMDRIIALKTPLAKITGFFMQSRQACEMTWEQWMLNISGATYEKRFKEHFKKSLREMQENGYTIDFDSETVLIKKPDYKTLPR